jgi:aurora kinase, other
MYGFFFDDRRIYIIMEFATVGELYSLFKKVGRFNEATVSCYIRQMIAAMKHLHEHNIIHRDLKPENILIF